MDQNDNVTGDKAPASEPSYASSITIDTIDGKHYNPLANDPGYQESQKLIRKKIRWENAAITTGVFQCVFVAMTVFLFALAPILTLLMFVAMGVEVIFVLLNIVVLTTYMVKIKPQGIGSFFSLLSYGLSGLIIMLIIRVSIS